MIRTELNVHPCRDRMRWFIIAILLMVATSPAWADDKTDDRKADKSEKTDDRKSDKPDERKADDRKSDKPDKRKRTAPRKRKASKRKASKRKASKRKASKRKASKRRVRRRKQRKRPPVRRAPERRAAAPAATPPAVRGDVVKVVPRSAVVRPRPPKTVAERIVEKLVVALGDREAWGHVRAVKATGITQLVTLMGTRKAKLVAFEIRPGYQRVDMTFNGQSVTQSHHPKGGWIRQNGAVFQLPRSMVDMTKAEMARSNLELRYATEKIQVKRLRSRTIRGQECDVIVFVDAKGNRTTYYISTKDSLLLKRSYVGPSPLGTGKQRFTTYQSDFRWVRVGNGKLKVRMPFKIENYIGGRKIGVIQIDRVSVNDPSITKQTFLRPSPVE